MTQIGFQSRKAAKAFFFDRPRVVNMMDRQTRRALAQFGAFVRTTARRSIRERKGVSRPGQPPSSHTGALRNNIFFAAEPDRGSVVIGPTPLNQRSERDTPRLLEEGGTAVRRFWIKDPETGRLREPGEIGIVPGATFVRTRRAPAQRVRYRPRPYMGPAFEKAKSRLARFWN